LILSSKKQCLVQRSRLDYDDAMKRVLAIDIGGTKIAVGIVDARGTVLAKSCAKTPRGDPGAVIALTMTLAAQAGYEAGVAEAVGLALPGLVDGTGEILLNSPSSGWNDVPFTRLVREAFGLPVVAGNDVNACALAEATFGSGADFDPFLWMTVSTGIGGAVFCGGHVLRGAHGMAGEIGHMVVRPGGAVCACGKRGCLEAEAAGPAWTRKFHSFRGQEDGARERERMDAQAIAEGARSGDATCLRVVDDVSDALASGLGNAITLIDPRAVFLGGGVAGASDLLIPRIEALMPGRTFAWESRTVSILQSALGYDAALVGAAALAFGQKHER
jgi:glucokinase